MKLGDKVIYTSTTRSKQDDFDWLEKGMIGKLSKFHPAIPSTGLMMESGGEMVKDEGLKEWWTVDFGKAGTRAVDTDDLLNPLSHYNLVIK